MINERWKEKGSVDQVEFLDFKKIISLTSTCGKGLVSPFHFLLTVTENNKHLAIIQRNQ